MIYFFLMSGPNSLDERRGYNISTSTIKEWIVMIRVWLKSLDSQLDGWIFQVGVSICDRQTNSCRVDPFLFCEKFGMMYDAIYVYLIYLFTFPTNFATVRGSHLKI